MGPYRTGVANFLVLLSMDCEWGEVKYICNIIGLDILIEVLLHAR